MTASMQLCNYGKASPIRSGPRYPEQQQEKGVESIEAEIRLARTPCSAAFWPQSKVLTPLTRTHAFRFWAGHRTALDSLGREGSNPHLANTTRGRRRTQTVSTPFQILCVTRRRSIALQLYRGTPTDTFVLQIRTGYPLDRKGVPSLAQSKTFALCFPTYAQHTRCPMMLQSGRLNRLSSLCILRSVPQSGNNSCARIPLLELHLLPFLPERKHGAYGPAAPIAESRGKCYRGRHFLHP